MPKIHPSSIYQITRPSRFEPKFIGIAQTLMEHKQKRLQMEKVYKDTHNNLLYAQKRNLDLSKSLNQKEKKLQRLQEIKERHENDILNKRRQHEENTIKLEQLQRKTMFERKKLKSNIKERVSQMKKDKKHSKNQAKRKSQQLVDQLQHSNTIQFQKLKSLHESIKDRKQQLNKKVDDFYRKKNLQSLNNYNKLIKIQDDKSIFFQMNIETIKRTIETIAKDNASKQKQIQLVDEDIQKMSPLKSFFNSRLDRTQMVGFSRSSQKSINSKRPSEILLDEFLAAQNQINQRPRMFTNNKEKYLTKDNSQKQTTRI